jgi:hypothetical protein
LPVVHSVLLPSFASCTQCTTTIIYQLYTVYYYHHLPVVHSVLLPSFASCTQCTTSIICQLCTQKLLTNKLFKPCNGKTIHLSIDNWNNKILAAIYMFHSFLDHWLMLHCWSKQFYHYQLQFYFVPMISVLCYLRKITTCTMITSTMHHHTCINTGRVHYIRYLSLY